MASVLSLTSRSTPTLGGGGGTVFLSLASGVAGLASISDTTAAGTLTAVTDGDYLLGLNAAGTYVRKVLKSSIITTDASLLTSGTLADARLSANVPLLNAANVFSVGGQQINSAAAGSVPLTLKAHSGQTANAFEIQDSGGVALYRFVPEGGRWNNYVPYGSILAGASSPGCHAFNTAAVGSTAMIVATGSSSNVGLILKGATSQSANLTEWQDSAGSVGTYIDAARNIYTNALLTTTGGAQGVRVISSEVSFHNTSRLGWYNAASFNAVDLAVGRQSAGLLSLSDAATANDIGFRFQRKSSTTAGQDVAQILASWADSTHATRTGQVSIGAYYTSTLQEGLRIVAGSVGTPAVSAYGRLTVWNTGDPTKGLSVSTKAVDGRMILSHTDDAGGNHGITFWHGGEILELRGDTRLRTATAGAVTVEQYAGYGVVAGYGATSGNINQLRISSSSASGSGAVLDVFPMRYAATGQPSLRFTSNRTSFWTPSDDYWYYTPATEVLVIDGNTSGVTQRVLVSSGVATAVALTVKGAASQSANLTEWQDSGGTVLASVGPAGTVKTLTTTVSGLPAAATAGAGARAFVTDATVTTFASAVTGGGANAVPVYSDGSAWYIG